MYRDRAAAASPTYNVFATASAAEISAEVKMLVINGVPPNSSFQSGGSVALALNCTLAFLPLTDHDTHPQLDCSCWHQRGARPRGARQSRYLRSKQRFRYTRA